MAKNHQEETVIAHGVRIEGEFISQGDVLIEGELNGVLKTMSDLRVGESSKIQADVSAKNAVIAGSVSGNILIEGRLELLATASIQGDVIAQILAVNAGAQVNGQITMGAAAKREKPQA